ncbi:unnamed protein product [Cuscuta epithymum]|uniref:Uncharacterized protein n=1 Tax=Cuscuta epithymum TaxID=186058 RepID=A0AAV0DMZ3_9ASTE|nr:unnamed protein product [Cuscuta epithymum]
MLLFLLVPSFPCSAAGLFFALFPSPAYFLPLSAPLFPARTSATAAADIVMEETIVAVADPEVVVRREEIGNFKFFLPLFSASFINLGYLLILNFIRPLLLTSTLAKAQPASIVCVFFILR